MKEQSVAKAEETSGRPSLSRYRWVILAVAVAVHATVVMSGQALAPLAPFLLGDLASNRMEVGLMVSALLVGGAVGSTPGGWLADRSVRWTFLGGQALLGIMVFLVSRATSLQASLIPLFLGGLGFGTIIITGTRAVAGWFPARERGMALGIVMAAAPLGSAVAAASLPALGQAWGWRQALLPMAVLAVASGVVSSILYRPSPAELLSGREGAPPPRRPWDILKRRDTWLLGLAAVLMGGAEHAFRTYFLLYLTEVAFLSVVLGGWYLSLAYGSGLFGRIGWGVISDRWFGGRREGVFAMVPLVAAFALLLLGLGWGSPWVFPLAGLLFGFSGGGWVGIWTTMLVERSGSGSAGGELGLGFTFGYVGVILGPTLFGRGVDMTGSYQTMWLAVAAVTVLASLGPLLLRGRSLSH